MSYTLPTRSTGTYVLPEQSEADTGDGIWGANIYPWQEALPWQIGAPGGWTLTTKS